MYENLFTESGLSLDRLRSFMEIVTAGGFTSAAKGDPTKQSQFSRQLKELEEFFGVELIRRGKGGFSLTPAGRELDRISRDYFGSLATFKASCTGQSLSITIGAGDSLIQWLILPKLAELHQSVRMSTFLLKNMQSREIVESLYDGRIDMAILRKASVGKGLKRVLLCNHNYRLFIPKRLVASGQAIESPGILAQIPLAVLEGMGSVNRFLDLEVQKLGITTRILVACSSYPQVAEVVRRNQAAAILPEIAERSFDLTKVIKVHLSLLDGLSHSLVLAWNDHHVRTHTALKPAIPIISRLLT